MKIDELIARLGLVADYLDQRKMHGKARACPKAVETIRMLNAVPAADVRPVVRGRWIKCGDNQPMSNDKVYCCSNCKGNKRLEWHLKPFCEDCGADMREVDDAR